MSPRLPGTRALAAWLRQRTGDWLGRRVPVADPRITLERRRLFILPTGLGYTFGATMLLLLIGSLNYGASLGFAITFLLAGCGVLGMLHTYRNLEGLVLGFAPAPAVFAGETAWFPVRLEAPERQRWAIELAAGEASRTVPATTPSEPDRTRIPLATRRRGRLPLPRLTVATRWPLMLFRAWSWTQPAVSVVVYPSPVDHGYPRPSTADDGGGQTARRGAEDFAGLREYRPGDPPRRIAWKALARTDELCVKAFDAATAAEIWLDWASLHGLEPEARLEQLCEWVLTADRDGRRYGLSMPGLRIAPATGPAHRRRCLEALALTGLPGTGYR